MGTGKYDDRGADRLEDYVRKRYGQDMSNSEMHLYVMGLRYLERQGAGLCETVVKSLAILAAAARLSINTVVLALEKCVALGLIDYMPGQALRRGAAAQVRRRSIQELEQGVSRAVLRRHTPIPAERNAERLRGRLFWYGGREVSPLWHAAKTGRLGMRKPCPQNDSKETRRDNLRGGLRQNHELVHVDFRQAEPTVGRHILTTENLCPAQWPADVYQELGAYLGQPRNDVKPLFMAGLFYSHSAVAHAHKWGILPGHFINELAKACDEYKARLWQRSKPRKGHRRHVHTLGGTLIEALKNERVHKGRLFNWQVQGTVADVMNAAVAELLDLEAERDWQFLFPVHDAVYLAGPAGSGREVEAIMQKHARALGLTLECETEETHPEPGEGLV